MGKIEKELKDAGAIVYVISYEDATQLKAMKEQEKLGETFVFLADQECKAGAKYAGRYPDNGTLVPATFVIGKDRKIVFAEIDEKFSVRPAAQAVLEAVRKAKMELRRSLRTRS